MRGNLRPTLTALLATAVAAVVYVGLTILTSDQDLGSAVRDAVPFVVIFGVVMLVVGLFLERRARQTPGNDR